jgi:hypothetical protein
MRFWGFVCEKKPRMAAIARCAAHNAPERLDTRLNQAGFCRAAVFTVFLQGEL